MARTQLPDHIKSRGQRLAEALKAAREDRGLSQEAVARRTGWVSVYNLVKLEGGRTANPGLFTVTDVAAALETSVEALTSDDPPQEPGR